MQQHINLSPPSSSRPFSSSKANIRLVKNVSLLIRQRQNIDVREVSAELGPWFLGTAETVMVPLTVRIVTEALSLAEAALSYRHTPKPDL